MDTDRLLISAEDLKVDLTRLMLKNMKYYSKAETEAEAETVLSKPRPFFKEWLPAFFNNNQFQAGVKKWQPDLTKKAGQPKRWKPLAYLGWL